MMTTREISASVRSSNSEAMDSYVKALEEEKKKILVFERELPLSLQLVTQAIGSCRQQLEELEDQQQQQHVDREEILTNGPVLEEFMPLRPSNSSSSTEEEEEVVERNCDGDNKPDWLRSVQLWKEPADQPRGHVLIRKPIAVSVKRVGAGGAFHPFEREKNVKGPVIAAAPASLTTETNGGEEKEGHSSQRKARRCWSWELHRRFLNVLNQLGGSHAATPKQIRDLMKVDALTNDEVKSHLQKYRLHTRRPNSSRSNSAQTPQILLLGGLWMPPPDQYTAAAAAAAAQPISAETPGVPVLNGVVYAPVAALSSELGSGHLEKNKQLQSKKSPTGSPLNSGGRCSGDDGSEDAW